MFLPFFRGNLSTCGLMLVFFSQLSSIHLTSISQSKWPMLHTMASFFIASKCFPVMMSASGGGDKDVSLADGLFHCRHLVTLTRGPH